MTLFRKNLIKAVLVVFLTLGIAACGGSSSDSPVSNNISGFVADGYLSGATVFLDCNDNRVQDPDEISSTTDDAGRYVLDTSGVGSVADCPVVAEVTDTTIDLDTDMPVLNPYTLVAPSGYTAFVSPLTTMIQVNYESNPGITIQEAHDTVKGMLAVDDQSTVSLFEDYIDNSTSGGADADAYENLHRFAQVTARVLGDNLDQLEQAAQAQSYTITDEIKDDLLRMTVKEIMQKADLINDVIASDDPSESGGAFNPDADAQAVDISVYTGDVGQSIQQEQAVYDNQVPTLKWAGIFRAYWSGGGVMDIFSVGLENDIDTTGYEFSIDGPGFTYTFVADDFDDDPYAPVAMYKLYNSDDLRAAGEYIFYITPPGGVRTEVGRDTHDTSTTIDVITNLNASVMLDADGNGYVYHDTLNGTYYYRMVIRDRATESHVYRGKRKNSGVQLFPAQYATADYQYRIEAWDTRMFADAVARSQTGWQNFGTPVDVGSGGAKPAYHGAYWRQHYAFDGTTSIQGNRKVLDIAISNHSDLAGLTLTSNRGFSYTLPVDEAIGYILGNDDYFVEKREHEMADGESVIDYYLQIKHPLAGAETFTWTATTVLGSDFTVTATIQDQNPLPCVDPASVSMTEDDNGLLTISWDGVDTSVQEQALSYRIRIRNVTNDLDRMFRSKRMPKTTIYIPRSDIEAIIGTSLTDSNVDFRIEVYDSNIYSSIHNWTQFNYMGVTLN